MGKKLFLTAGVILVISAAVHGPKADAASKKVTYTLKGSTLTVKGKGRMPSDMKFGGKKKTKKVKTVIIKKGVTAISSSAFANCKKLKKVTIANSVEKIGNSAFKNTALVNVKIPDSVKYMGDHAFLGCSKLTRISTPVLYTVYDAPGDEVAVLNDKPLDKLVITSRIKSLSNLTFCGFSTRSYVVSDKDKQYTSVDGAVYTKDGRELVYVASRAKELKIPASCTVVDLSSFSHDTGDDCYVECKDLSEITIPATVEQVKACNGDSNNMKQAAFTVLTEKLGADSVVALTDFMGLENAKAAMPDAFTQEGAFTICMGITLYKDSDQEKTFQNLTEVTVPEGIQTIPDSFFADCVTLEKVTLPESVETIGNSAFARCRNLKEINFPSNLKEIGENAFYFTQIGECIPDEWMEKSTDFYTSYESEQEYLEKWAAMYKNVGEIKCTETIPPTAYRFESTEAGKYVKLTMQADGILVLRSGNGGVLCDHNKKEISLYPSVKTGDVFFVKLPDSIPDTFKINEVYINPVNAGAVELGNDAMYVGTGGNQYITFGIKEKTGFTSRITDYAVRGSASGISMYLQKKRGDDWISVSPVQNIRSGKNWDKYTHMSGSFAKDLYYCLAKGSYRVAVKADRGAVFELSLTYYSYDGYQAGAFKSAATRAKAIALYESDPDLEPYGVDHYYRIGAFSYSDKNTNWYKFKKDKKKTGKITIAHEYISTGNIKAGIYRKGTKKALKTVTFTPKKTLNKKVRMNFSVKKKGTYYVKVTRQNKKTSGTYSVAFNYKK